MGCRPAGARLEMQYPRYRSLLQLSECGRYVRTGGNMGVPDRRAYDIRRACSRRAQDDSRNVLRHTRESSTLRRRGPKDFAASIALPIRCLFGEAHTEIKGEVPEASCAPIGKARRQARDDVSWWRMVDGRRCEAERRPRGRSVEDARHPLGKRRRGPLWRRQRRRPCGDRAEAPRTVDSPPSWPRSWRRRRSLTCAARCCVSPATTSRIRTGRSRMRTCRRRSASSLLLAACWSSRQGRSNELRHEFSNRRPPSDPYRRREPSAAHLSVEETSHTLDEDPLRGGPVQGQSPDTTGQD